MIYDSTIKLLIYVKCTDNSVYIQLV